jgi:cytochrome c-type biogenesis protein CcmH/NrfG
MLDIAVGEFAQAEHVLALTAGPEAEALTARCRVAAGDIAGAQQIGERLLKQDQNDVSTLNLMAQIALRRGEPAEGVRFLRRALRSDPFDGEASQLLANLEANQ